MTSPTGCSRLEGAHYDLELRHFRLVVEHRSLLEPIHRLGLLWLTRLLYMVARVVYLDAIGQRHGARHGHWMYLADRQ